MILTTTDKVKEVINKLEEKREKELQNVPSLEEFSGTLNYSKEWLIINCKINHDIERLENLMFDVKYNKTAIDKNEVEKIERHLQKIGVLEE